MKVAFRKVTVCVSSVALDFQEDKLDIAKWSKLQEIEISIELTDAFFKKVRH
uniref:Protein COQ10 B, mitochondrial n=1 Tax=Solanum tuberosum TaxID=4113 RepID=M1ADR7_SOLTU